MYFHMAEHCSARKRDGPTHSNRTNVKCIALSEGNQIINDTCFHG